VGKKTGEEAKEIGGQKGVIKDGDRHPGSSFTDALSTSLVLPYLVCQQGLKALKACLLKLKIFLPLFELKLPKLLLKFEQCVRKYYFA
jgi:hypothetical protein